MTKRLKRKSRADVIIDKIDMGLLFLIPSGKGGSVLLPEIKDSLNLSHNSLIIHLVRLRKYGFIRTYRKKSDHKVKFITLTELGQELKKIMKISLDIQNNE